jgi:hypothetical protein
MIYDIFYVSKQQVDAENWQQFRQRFPSAQKIENVKTIDDVKKKSFTKFFWLVWDDLIVTKDFAFDYRIEKWDEEYIHVFLNGSVRDGICLFPKSATIIQKEFDHRYYINKKELDIVASNPKPHDVVFISYNESNADENYEKLKLKRSDAKRVHGVKGIHSAHIAAAKLATTEMFWVVDADANILKKFNFEFEYIPHYNQNERKIVYNTVHVWRSVNPVNGLVYGYGGVKLLPRELTLNMDVGSPDMTTSISKDFKLMPKISNSTMFNIDEFSTWRSAFRECVKLSSKTIDRLYDEETEERLMIWCALGINQPFGAYSIGGAKAGKRYGELNIAKKEMLLKINDFEWLEEQFLKWKKEYNE